MELILKKCRDFFIKDRQTCVYNEMSSLVYYDMNSVVHSLAKSISK